MMTLHWALKTTWSDTVPLPARTVRANLESAFADGRIVGKLDEAGFLVTRVRGQHLRNSWRPRINGTVTEIDGHCRVDVIASVHPLVFAFTLVHGLFFLGITWIMGTIGFSAGLPWMRAALSGAVMGESSSAAASNPTSWW